MCDDLFASTGNAGSMWPCRHVDATMRGIVRPPHRKLTACSRPQSAQVRRHRPARREPHTPSGGGRHALRGVRCMSAVDSPNASSDPVEKRKNTSLYREVAAADLAVDSDAHRVLLQKPEVLAPAGGWEQAKAAVANGADAIYLGLSDFNARARACNFDPGDELVELMRFLHENGVKGYVTMNVLVFDAEMPRVEERVRQMATAGVDAVIVQDLGVVQLIRRVAPNLPVHGSTQMSITSAEGVAFAASLGVTRMVVGRELSVKEIEKIAAAARTAPHPTGASEAADIECFVHGALCVSYSGQCFSSEAWGGRSANRGQCAQACRLPYGLVVDGKLTEMGDIQYLLSPQDLMAVEQVPALMRAGVACFKIEGRLKGAAYVALTTQVYRRAVDTAWEAMTTGGDPQLHLSLQEMHDLQQVFSRGQSEAHDGLTPGFLDGVQHQRLVQGRSPRHRGVLLGRVAGMSKRGVKVALRAPVKRGDGVVFEHGQVESDEVGGAVYEVFDGSGRMLGAKEQVHTGIVELTFAKGMRLNGVMAGDIVWRTSDPTLEGRIHAAATAGPARGGIRQRDENGVTAVFQGAVGQLLRLTLVDPLGHAGSATSTMELAVASARPVDEAALSKALGEQLGGGPLHLATLDTSALDLAAGLFLPAKEVKQMRRDAVTQLLARRTEHGRAAQLRQQGDAGPSETAVLMEELRPVAGDGEAAGASTIGDAAARITVLCRTRAQVEAALQVDWLDEVIVDFLEVQGLKEACESVRSSGRRVVVATPRVLKPDEARLWQFYLKLHADALLVRSAGLLQRFHELGGAGATVLLPGGESAVMPALRGDFSLNAANVLSTRHLLGLGLERLTPTHDLNAHQLQELAQSLTEAEAAQLECVIHQHLPIFHTEHCVFCRFLSDGNSYLDCGHPCEAKQVHLRDEHGKDHLVLADMGCRNTVFNAQAQSGAYYLHQLTAAGFRHFRVELVDEPAQVVAGVLQQYAALAAGDATPKQVWAWVSQLPDANGNVGGVSGGSLETHAERGKESMRAPGTPTSAH